MTDLDKLEALAKAATPGEWRVSEDNNPFADGRHVFAKGLDGSDFVVLNLKTDHTFVTATTRAQQQANAQFSAAANPATILDLIASARRDAEEIERLIGYAGHDDACTTNRFPGQGVCSCGLSSLLQRVRPDRGRAAHAGEG